MLLSIFLIFQFFGAFQENAQAQTVSTCEALAISQLERQSGNKVCGYVGCAPAEFSNFKYSAFFQQGLITVVCDCVNQTDTSDPMAWTGPTEAIIFQGEVVSNLNCNNEPTAPPPVIVPDPNISAGAGGLH